MTRAVAAHEQLERERAVDPPPRLEPERPTESRSGRQVSWDHAREVGATREVHRDFDGALAIYSRVRRTPADRVELDIAMARCCVELYRATAAHTHA
jgi:hypothetical protein